MLRGSRASRKRILPQPMYPSSAVKERGSGCRDGTEIVTEHLEYQPKRRTQGCATGTPNVPRDFCVSLPCSFVLTCPLHLGLVDATCNGYRGQLRNGSKVTYSRYDVGFDRCPPPLQREHWRLNTVSAKQPAPVPICPASAISETMTSDLLCSVALRYDCSLAVITRQWPD